MPAPKDAALAMIRDLPDDASFEEMQYKLYVLEQVDLGEKSVQESGALSTGAARERLSKWLAD